MVKKISGNSPIRPGGSGTKVGGAGEVKGPGGVQKTQGVQGPEAVQSKAPIQTSGVKSVGSVGQTRAGDRSARVRNSTRPLTPAERQYLLELVSEEAEKMFGDGKISQRKRQIIENSVKMTLSAGSSDDDEES